MKLSIVVAHSTNHVIGADGRLPWHLPEDLRHFKNITMGKPIVMGRFTHESIGRALPGRRNLVLSRQPGYLAGGCEVVDSGEALFDALADEDEIMIIGGGQLYRRFLPQVERIYRTRVAAEVAGDTFFPLLDDQHWEITEAEEFPVSDKRPIGFTLEVLRRLQAE